MEINKENLRKINIKEIALKKELGAFAFENANKKLEKIRKWIVELEDLDYKSELPDNIINSINNLIEELLGHLRWLQAFDITTSGNAKQDHDSFELRIDGFYNNFVNLVLTSLTYLRQEADTKGKDKKTIQREQKNLIQARKQYDEIISGLKQQQKDLQKEKSKIASSHGEIGAVKFGKHFELQAYENKFEADKWLKRGNVFYWILFVIISLNVIGYFGLFIGNKINQNIIQPTEFFTLQYGLAKLALLTIISYAVSFCSRNFNINSNLSALNKHRKNVAETVNDFLFSNPEKEDRTKFLIAATESMFKHQPIGYLPKIESKDDGPIASIINHIIKPFG